jgi:hypothetical protein
MNTRTENNVDANKYAQKLHSKQEVATRLREATVTALGDLKV